MQRVTNCVIHKDGKVLLLQKPRRGWWYPPGGKVDPLETIYEAITREVEEETGLHIVHPELKSVMSIVIKEREEVVDEWMLFTFYTDEADGELHADSHEGELSWVPLADALHLPMPEGDRLVLAGLIESKSVLIGRFVYTPDYELLAYDLHT